LWALDAVPKKRGPKTDVLEALLKRVDGLEARLKEKKTEPETPISESGHTNNSGDPLATGSASHQQPETRPTLSLTESPPNDGAGDPALFSPTKSA
jgi:hypothetical protein